MEFRVTTWWHIAAYSLAIISLAITLSLSVVCFFMPPVPWFFKVPFYTIAALIPFFISAPVSVAGLYMFKRINATIDALDAHVKFDPLTGLLSRGYFLSSAGRLRTRGGYFLMIDADHFKKVNDTYGHDGGDEALKTIAHAIQHLGAGQGICGRLGGEEFAVYLPGANPEQARLFAAGLGTAIRNTPCQIGSHAVRLTVSIGVAGDAGRGAFTTVIKQADEALYNAKASGRDRFTFFESMSTVHSRSA